MTNQQKEQIRTMRLSDNTVRSFCRRNGLCDKSKNAVACKQCGKLIKIIPKQKPKKFCSDSCRNTWWNEHRDYVNRKANYEYTCACCGRNFTAYGNNHRKYCSHACYIKYGISSCSLYGGIDLIYDGFRGNMSHYKEVTLCQEK